MRKLNFAVECKDRRAKRLELMRTMKRPLVFFFVCFFLPKCLSANMEAIGMKKVINEQKFPRKKTRETLDIE